MNQQLSDTMWASNWTTVSNEARAHAETAAQHCHAKFAKLILAVAERFCAQPSPSNEEEFNRRVTQATFLTAKIDSIVHADTMAKLHLKVAVEILELTKEYCEQVSLGAEVLDESLSFTAAVRNLAQDEMLRRIRGDGSVSI